MIIQRYVATNLYAFYEVANSYEFVRPHSYDFVRFVYTNSYELATL